MNDLHERILHRLRATGKSYRRASLDGGLSQEAISKILSIPANSPTLDTVRKLAVGLETSPEWLAFGIDSEQPNSSRSDRPDPLQKVNGKVSTTRPRVDTTALPDNASIQVAVGTLRRLVSGALQTENIPAEQADAHADAVLELLKEQLVSSVVYHPAENAHRRPGSAAPKPVDQ